MNEPITAALTLAGTLTLLGAGTAVVQVRGLRRLAARARVPSDERAFYRGRYRRRLVVAAVLLAAGGMIGGAYLSGMEARAAAIGEGRRRAEADPDALPNVSRPVPDQDRQFVRLWGLYWIAVVGLVFALVGLALNDAWASRRYWYAQYRRLREEHQTKLRRDLAVYKSQKSDRRGRLGGRLGGSDDT